MAVVVPNEAERNIIDMVRYFIQSRWIKLYQGALTIDANTTLAALDAAEADYSGYSAITRSDWTTPSTDVAGNGYIVCSSAVFQHNGGGISNSIHGWYLVGNKDSNDVLICCEEFSSPITMATIADILTISPKLFLRQGP